MQPLDHEKAVDEIVQKAAGSSLIALLQEVQSHYTYLPEQVLVLVGKKLSVPLSRIFALATFYRSFSLKPRGKNTLKVCLGTACHVKSGTNLLEKAKRELHLPGEEDTTSDLTFTVEKVRCLGCCSLAPVVRVNEETYGSMTQEKLSRVLKRYF